MVQKYGGCMWANYGAKVQRVFLEQRLKPDFGLGTHVDAWERTGMLTFVFGHKVSEICTRSVACV